MSGYKDSTYWASDDEIAAYRERQQASAQVSEPANQPAAKPAYMPHRSVREGERVSVTVRACKPVKLDGFDI